MRKYMLGLSLLCMSLAAKSQTVNDSTDVFYRHLDINEVTVTGLTGKSRMREMPTPVSIVTNRELQATASANIIDAISRRPGISQLTTGSGISKPIIRGLGFNRVAVVNDGIRQEGQQWGDEHGIEVDGQSVGSVEILKGPASLMYGSDAMAGVIIMHPHPTLPQGKMKGSVESEYQTNNGLAGYSVNLAGNAGGFVWDGRWSQKGAHAYKNKRDGYVPGTQFGEQAARLMAGLSKAWGHSLLTMSYYHLTPSIAEGERDEQTGELEHGDNFRRHGYSKTLPFQQVYHYKAVWDHAQNLGNGQLKVLAGYQQNRRQEFEESADDYELYFRLHTVNYDVRYQATLPTATGEPWHVAAGAGGMWQRSQNRGEEVLIPAYRLFDAGLFATVSHRWGAWNVTGGVRADRRWLHSEALTDDDGPRFDDFRRHFGGLSGSIGAVWNILDGLDLRANLSRGFRAPNLSELGSNGTHEGTQRYEIGTHRLKAEHSWQVDLGLDFSGRYVSAQLALYANRIDNFVYIARDANMALSDDGLPVFRYAAGDARLLGMEAAVDLHPIHSLHFENTFSMVDARQLHQSADTRYLPFTPAPRWTSELKYELTHDGRLFDHSYVAVGLECNWRQTHIYRAYDTETETSGYSLFHVSAGTDLKPRGRHVASLYLTVQNVFDRVYQNHLSRLKYTDVNPLTGRMGIAGMGRNVCLRLVVPVEVF